MAKLTPSGVLDTSYGTGGLTRYRFVPQNLPSGSFVQSYVRSARASADRSIVLFAYSSISQMTYTSIVQGRYDYAAARLRPDGQQDLNFDRVTIPFDFGTDLDDFAKAVAIGPDGSVVRAGGVSVAGPLTPAGASYNQLPYD